MTEADWLAATDVPTLLRWAVPRGTRRQLRPYLCGGCRANWHLLYHPTCRDAVETAERRAEGLASDNDLFVARFGAEAVAFGNDFREEWLQQYPERRNKAVQRLIAFGALPHTFYWGDEWRVDDAVEERLLAMATLTEAACSAGADPTGFAERWWLPYLERADWPGRWIVDCVYGNPFRPQGIAPDWQTPTVLALAEGVYADRGHDRLLVLADALEDAGCDDPTLLAHCRGGGPHVRGCWAIDRLLDKPDEPATAVPG